MQQALHVCFSRMRAIGNISESGAEEIMASFTIPTRVSTALNRCFSPCFGERLR